MAQAITIHIPDTLYDQLKHTAELSQRSIDTIVAHSLPHSIAPLLEDIPAEYQAEVYPLLEMDETALQAEVQRVFPMDRWSAYETLLEKKQEGRLTEKENTTLSITVELSPKSPTENPPLERKKDSPIYDVTECERASFP